MIPNHEFYRAYGGLEVTVAGKVRRCPPLTMRQAAVCLELMHTVRANGDGQAVRDLLTFIDDEFPMLAQLPKDEQFKVLERYFDAHDVQPVADDDAETEHHRIADPLVEMVHRVAAAYHWVPQPESSYPLVCMLAERADRVHARTQYQLETAIAETLGVVMSGEGGFALQIKLQQLLAAAEGRPHEQAVPLAVDQSARRGASE